MDTGHIIAINLSLLYIILGPLVLVAIYVFFDALSKPNERDENRQDTAARTKDPALWTNEDINAYVSRF
jgi:hypothetical protein